jgi:hypothetical protein
MTGVPLPYREGELELATAGRPVVVRNALAVPLEQHRLSNHLPGKGLQRKMAKPNSELASQKRHQVDDIVKSN